MRKRDLRFAGIAVLCELREEITQARMCGRDDTLVHCDADGSGQDALRAGIDAGKLPAYAVILVMLQQQPAAAANQAAA
ncbi:hypothetical protein D3C71_1635700 [compost metagenome]